MEGPAAPAEHDLPAEEEPGAGDHGAQPQAGAGGVEEGGVPQEPQAVAGGDPVIAVVFGVAVAGDDLVLLAEGLVHSGDVVPRQQVVGVEDEEAVEVVVPPGVPDLGEQEVEGVALAHVLAVEALVDHGAGVPGGAGGAVGAVVRHHEGGEVLGGVVLVPDALQKLADDRLLVPGGDEHGVAPQRGGPVHPVPAPQGNGDVEKLVEIAQHEQDADDTVHVLAEEQSSHDSLLSRARQMAR